MRKPCFFKCGYRVRCPRVSLGNSANICRSKTDRHPAHDNQVSSDSTLTRRQELFLNRRPFFSGTFCTVINHGDNNFTFVATVAEPL